MPHRDQATINQDGAIYRRHGCNTCHNFEGGLLLLRAMAVSNDVHQIHQLPASHHSTVSKLLQQFLPMPSVTCRGALLVRNIGTYTHEGPHFLLFLA